MAVFSGTERAGAIFTGLLLLAGFVEPFFIITVGRPTGMFLPVGK